MKSRRISFVTPYYSGTKWLEIHLATIRNFHPDAEIIISAPDDSVKSICDKYEVRFFANNTDYHQALAFMFDEATYDTIVLSDCDTAVFTNLDYLVSKLEEYDLISIEERIRHAVKDRWFRLAPGYTDLSFFIFDRNKAKSVNSHWPYFPPTTPNPGYQNFEEHYAICELLPKHYYLRPYTTQKYGLGNLIRDGDKNIAWHQWFGSWEKRASFISERQREDNPYPNMEELRNAEERFFVDYPDLDFTNLKLAF